MSDTSRKPLNGNTPRHVNRERDRGPGDPPSADPAAPTRAPPLTKPAPIRSRPLQAGRRTADAPPPEVRLQRQRTNSIEQILATVPEACSVLRVARTTLYAEIKAGRLKATKLRRATRFTVEELKRYAAELAR